MIPCRAAELRRRGAARRRGDDEPITAPHYDKYFEQDTTGRNPFDHNRHACTPPHILALARVTTRRVLSLPRRRGARAEPVPRQRASP